MDAEEKKKADNIVQGVLEMCRDIYADQGNCYSIITLDGPCREPKLKPMEIAG